jgi:hypothetical protein
MVVPSPGLPSSSIHLFSTFTIHIAAGSMTIASYSLILSLLVHHLRGSRFCEWCSTLHIGVCGSQTQQANTQLLHGLSHQSPLIQNKSPDHALVGRVPNPMKPNNKRPKKRLLDARSLSQLVTDVTRRMNQSRS